MTEDTLLAMAQSLETIIHRETEVLERPGNPQGLAALADAKARHTEKLEAAVAARRRLDPNWPSTLPMEERRALADGFQRLNAASEANGIIIERRMRLSAGLLDAIAAEAQRLGGRRTRTYSSGGTCTDTRRATPISVNTSL
jgi:flagellar biosynthesis/type III secretory pathway chaperone